jgi:hypothetical protein
MLKSFFRPDPTDHVASMSLSAAFSVLLITSSVPPV